MRALLRAGLCGAAVLAGAGEARAQLPATLTQALVEAYDNNATLQEQRASLRATDETVPSALSGWRPTVEISGTAGRITGTTVQPSTSIDPLTGQLISQKVTLPESRDEAIAQVQLTQPIYTGGKVLSTEREAKNAVYAARAQLQATEQTVFLNVVNAYVTVITDTHVLALDQSNQEVLRQQLEATQDQFNVGEITLTSVAQAQASLAQAIEQAEVAAGNLQIARENFRELVGDYPGGVHRCRQQGCGGRGVRGADAAGEPAGVRLFRERPIRPAHAEHRRAGAGRADGAALPGRRRICRDPAGAGEGAE